MPPSRTPSLFFRGSTSRFVDLPALRSALADTCAQAARHCPAIERVLLFGSQASGRAGARSDADLLVVLSSSPLARRMDRIPDLLVAFGSAPVPLDIVPWTRDELREARKRNDPWLARIETEAVQLWPG